VSLLHHHVVLMLFYAAAVASFFALLWRSERKSRVRLFLIIFTSMSLGGLALGWLMFPFPIR
jgi:hypothetical protein